MEITSIIDKAITMVNSWDWNSILYSLIASTIFAFIMLWLGVFKSASKKIKLFRGIKKYRAKLKEECSTLIAIGRRNGFTMEDVYVELDIIKSDLSQQEDILFRRPISSYVLVGGPGAGKSTTVKKLIIKKLDAGNSLPFFVRLREYNGYNSIEEYLINKLEQFKIPDPHEVLRNELSKNSICVLDGLDEIRPQQKDKIFDDINQFYSKYFSEMQVGSQLIVSCRKEAYRNIPLNLPEIWEVRPLTDEQIQRFAENWPLKYPAEKSKDTFWRDLASTEKILELARSPLLLVGGLMQYTESNQGIPEERFEYLKRVAKWLVADWAAAQGHPADPNRPVYDRILAKIAFHMQKNQTSELSIIECSSLLKQWLPTFGHSETEASTLIESIATKTGILVREGGNNIVFAQFGLQEYFSSLEVITSVGINGIDKLKPITWWREVILLTAAQQREPSLMLETLFEYNPLLAVAAVAECPTPPIVMQNKAIEVCLEFIDQKDKAVGSATVNLLRKVRGEQESLLLRELEKRIRNNIENINNKEVKSLVSLSLATAGTPKATDLLAKYPEIWDTCLKEVGYLSNSFENLLVEWIKNGDKEQSTRAVDLIVSRLSSDRTKQLVAILPSLKREIAAHLASEILKSITNEDIRRTDYVSNSNNYMFDLISKCAPYVPDFNSFDNDEFIYSSHNPFVISYKNLTIKTLKICHENETKSSPQLLTMMYNATSWSTKFSFIIISSCACIFSLLLLSNDYLVSSFTTTAISLSAIFILSLSFPFINLPWFNHLVYRDQNIFNFIANTFLFFTGVISLYSFGYKPNDAAIMEGTNYILLLPILMILTSYPNSRRQHSYIIESMTRNKNRLLPFSGLIYCTLVFILILVNNLYSTSLYVDIVLLSLNVIYLAYLTYSAIKYFFDWRKFKNA